MDAKVYESSYREVKRLYRGTSCRKATAMEETVSAMNNIHALQRMGSSTSSRESLGLNKIAQMALEEKERYLTLESTKGEAENISGGSAALAERGEKIYHLDLLKILEPRTEQLI